MLNIELIKQDNVEEITSFALVRCPCIFHCFLEQKVDKDCFRAWALAHH